MAEPPIKVKLKRVRRGDKKYRRTAEQMYVKSQKAKRERIRYREELIKTHPDRVIVGAVDGRVLTRKEKTSKCERCTNDFTFLMTTRPLRYCPECRAILEEERRLRPRQRPKRPKPKPWPKGPRQVRYAGYDKSERVQESNYVKSEE